MLNPPSQFHSGKPNKYEKYEKNENFYAHKQENTGGNTNQFLFKQAANIITTNCNAKVSLNYDKAKNANIMRNSTDQILSNIKELEAHSNSGGVGGKVGSSKQKSTKTDDKKILASNNKDCKDKEIKLSNNQQQNNPGEKTEKAYQGSQNYQNNNYLNDKLNKGHSQDKTTNQNINITNNNINSMPQSQEFQFNNIQNANYIANLNLNINSNNPNFLNLQALSKDQKVDNKKKVHNENIDVNADYMEEKLKKLNNKNNQSSNKSFNNSGGAVNAKKARMKKTKSNCHMSDHLSLEDALNAIAGGVSAVAGHGGIQVGVSSMQVEPTRQPVANEKRSSSNMNGNSNNINDKSKMQKLKTNAQIVQQPQPNRSDSKKSSKKVDEKRDKSKDKLNEKEYDLIKNQLNRIEEKIIKSKNKTVNYLK